MADTETWPRKRRGVPSSRAARCAWGLSSGTCGASGPGRGALRRQRTTRATAREARTERTRLSVHSLREVLRGCVRARRHRPGSSEDGIPEHAHARHELRRELVRLVHRGERR